MAELGTAAVIAGFLLILLGVFLVFAGVMLQALRGEGRVEGGGVVVIGPIPILFGTSERAFLVAAAVGIIFMLLAIALLILARRALPAA